MAHPLSIPYKQIWNYDRWHTYQGKLTSAEVQQNPPFKDFNLNVNTEPINGHWYYGKIEVADMLYSVNRIETFYGNGYIQLGMYGKGTREQIWKAYPTNQGVWVPWKIFRVVPNTSFAFVSANVSATVRIRILDLSEMFGEGNEPTTVTQLRQMYPQIDQLSPFEPYRIGSTNA